MLGCWNTEKRLTGYLGNRSAALREKQEGSPKPYLEEREEGRDHPGGLTWWSFVCFCSDEYGFAEETSKGFAALCPELVGTKQKCIRFGGKWNTFPLPVKTQRFASFFLVFCSIIIIIKNRTKSIFLNN